MELEVCYRSLERWKTAALALSRCNWICGLGVSIAEYCYQGQCHALWSKIQSRARWAGMAGFVSHPCFQKNVPWAMLLEFWQMHNPLNSGYPQPRCLIPGSSLNISLPCISFDFSRGSGVHFGDSLHRDCHKSTEWNTVAGSGWMALKSSIWILFIIWNSEKWGAFRLLQKLLLSYHSVWR